MSQKETLYDSVYKIREVTKKPIQRIMLSGYLSEEEIKRDSISIEQYLKDALKSHRNVKAYIYVKGVFFIQLLQSQNIAHINLYLQSLHLQLTKRPTLFREVRIVHQSYQNAQSYLRGIQCDNNPQSGPVLVDTQKTQEQIQARSYQIYELFMQGAKKRSQNPSHKIATMILLSNDDMAILISSRFMNLGEYVDLYIGDMNVDREQEFNYPLPPSFFEIMQFLESQNYEDFRK